MFNKIERHLAIVTLAVAIVMGIAIITATAAETKLFEGTIKTVQEKISSKGNPMVIISFEGTVENFGMKYNETLSVFAFNTNIEKARSIQAGNQYKIVYTEAADGFKVYRHHEPLTKK